MSDELTLAPEPEPHGRLVAFLRSVLPAEPAQLLFLAGVTFLFISPELPWWPANASRWDSFRLSLSLSSFITWIYMVRGLSLPLVAVGAAGYFACFRRLRGNPAHGLVWILAGGLTGIFAVCGTAVFLSWGSRGGFHSVLLSRGEPTAGHLHDLVQLALDLGPGLRFSLAGLLMVAVCLFMLRRRRVTLPLRLYSTAAPAVATDGSEADDWDLNFFVPAMIALMPLVHLAEGAATGLIYLIRPPDLSGLQTNDWRHWLFNLIDALFFAAFVYLVLGKSRREVVARCVRWSDPKFAILAILFSVAVTQAWPFLCYLNDHISWVGLAPVLEWLPRLHGYFEFPQASALWLLVPAYVEEVAWRGYLQPRFIRRYGLWRGILFVGLVWGAFHFSWDFRHIPMTDFHVFKVMAWRLADTVAMGFVLSWITLRSRSILPAAIAHGFHNIFLESLHTITTPAWFAVLLWVILAYFLFRRWPPVTPGEPPMPAPLSEPDVAI
jgi:membrane protease YdiL (CAAX protease family)